MKMKELKHGSIEIVKSPDLAHSRKYLDFGKGFYTTTNGEMAKRWATIKMEREYSNEGYVNFYENKEFPPEFKVKHFTSMDEEWLDFIINNRNDLAFHHDYDVVIGPTADLDVVKIIQDYEQGIENKKQTLDKLKTKQVGTQISFHTERAVKHLKYIKHLKINKSPTPPGTKQKNYGINR